MKVLSIDLDYIMGPVIELYNNLCFDQNPTLRWQRLFDKTHFKESHFYIDQGNLLYCFNTYLKGLRHCDSVTFGYDHDAILYTLRDCKDIELINIDHHDDVFGGDFLKSSSSNESAYRKEYNAVMNHGKVHEGNWGCWLGGMGKLKSFVWIGNEGSRNKARNKYNEQVVPNYLNVERENYEFEDYNFDHIFVCLSPQYIPKQHWHYFAMFISTFEEMTGKDAIIHTDKFQFHTHLDRVHNEILHQCSNGR